VRVMNNEVHYTYRELGEMWGCSRITVNKRANALGVCCRYLNGVAWIPQREVDRIRRTKPSSTSNNKPVPKSDSTNGIRYGVTMDAIDSIVDEMFCASDLDDMYATGVMRAEKAIVALKIATAILLEFPREDVAAHYGVTVNRVVNDATTIGDARHQRSMYATLVRSQREVIRRARKLVKEKKTEKGGEA